MKALACHYTTIWTLVDHEASMVLLCDTALSISGPMLCMQALCLFPEDFLPVAFTLEPSDTSFQVGLLISRVLPHT